MLISADKVIPGPAGHVTVTMQEHPQSHMWLVVPGTPAPVRLLPVDSEGVVPGARPAAKNHSARLCLFRPVRSCPAPDPSVVTLGVLSLQSGWLHEV